MTLLSLPLVPVSSSISSTGATATVALRVSSPSSFHLRRPRCSRFDSSLPLAPLPFCSRSASSSSSLLFLFHWFHIPLFPLLFLLLPSLHPSFSPLSPSLHCSSSALLLQRLHQTRSQMLDSLRQVPLTIMTTLYPQVTTNTNT